MCVLFRPSFPYIYIYIYFFCHFVGNAFDMELFYRYEIPAVRGRNGGGGERVKRPKMLLWFKPSTRETSAAGAGEQHANR